MRLALAEAECGVGFTSPNPAVGAVVARGGRLHSRGYHHRAGEPHAEIEALRAARHTRGATLYVTLEPCSTHGRTPPCVDAIIAAGIARVVVGALDPNPRHAGRGLDLLRAAGIEVVSGVLESECTALNRPFNKWITSRRPWVIAKSGLSLDGRIARPAGEGQWLTSEAARADAQTLRRRADAIIIGANTLRADNPRLTVRGVEGKVQPWRVIVSSGKNPLPEKAHLFTDEHRDRTIVYRSRSLASVLRDLGRRYEVTCALLEGGGGILGQAFDAHLVDEVCFYLAPLLCSGPALAIAGRGVAKASQAPPLQDPQYRRIGPDLKLTALVVPRAQGAPSA